MMKIRLRKVASAFSLIEIIFVIIVLGIVSSIGAEIIAKAYRSYIMERAVYRAEMKTELAALQLINRFETVIPGTAYRIESGGGKTPYAQSINPSKTYKGIEWVAADIDSLNAGGWSGFCDVDPSTKSSLSSPGSNFNTVTTIESNLQGTGGLQLYFRRDYKTDGVARNYSVAVSDATHLSFSDTNSSKTIWEHYKLAWTSYAAVVEGGDLYLYYNFPATPGSDYTTGQKALLLKNVSKFKFSGTEHSIRFKLCKQESIGDTDFNVTACKEKVGF